MSKRWLHVERNVGIIIFIKEKERNKIQTLKWMIEMGKKERNSSTAGTWWEEKKRRKEEVLGVETLRYLFSSSNFVITLSQLPNSLSPISLSPTTPLASPPHFSTHFPFLSSLYIYFILGSKITFIWKNIYFTFYVKLLFNLV